MPFYSISYTTVNANTGAWAPLGPATTGKRIFVQPFANTNFSNDPGGVGAVTLLGGNANARYDFGVSDPSTIYVRSNSGTATNASVWAFDAGES
jgi:hypothetical protein